MTNDQNNYNMETNEIQEKVTLKNLLLDDYFYLEIS